MTVAEPVAVAKIVTRQTLEVDSDPLDRRSYRGNPVLVEKYRHLPPRWSEALRYLAAEAKAERLEGYCANSCTHRQSGVLGYEWDDSSWHGEEHGWVWRTCYLVRVNDGPILLVCGDCAACEELPTEDKDYFTDHSHPDPSARPVAPNDRSGGPVTTTG